jgi:hypothetical protein
MADKQMKLATLLDGGEGDRGRRQVLLGTLALEIQLWMTSDQTNSDTHLGTAHSG